MKHSKHCVLLDTRQLSALGGLLSLPVPPSVNDIVSHMPALPAPKAATTTLQAGINASTNLVPLTALIPAQAGDIILIDSEKMYVEQVIPADGQTPPQLRVFRSAVGTTAAAHLAAATITFPAVSAQDQVKVLIQNTLYQRADLTSTYVWPYQATPPNWAQKPNQIGGASAIGQTSETPGVVVPPAPYTLPDPAPPASVPPGVQADE